MHGKKTNIKRESSVNESQESEELFQSYKIGAKIAGIKYLTEYQVPNFLMPAAFPGKKEVASLEVLPLYCLRINWQAWCSK